MKRIFYRVLEVISYVVVATLVLASIVGLTVLLKLALHGLVHIVGG